MEYDLPLKLCKDIAKSLRSSNFQEKDEKAKFVEELPLSLRQEVCVHMYREVYNQVKFLKSK